MSWLIDWWASLPPSLTIRHYHHRFINGQSLALWKQSCLFVTLLNILSTAILHFCLRSGCLSVGLHDVGIVWATQTIARWCSADGERGSGLCIAGRWRDRMDGSTGQSARDTAGEMLSDPITASRWTGWQPAHTLTLLWGRETETVPATKCFCVEKRCQNRWINKSF